MAAENPIKIPRGAWIRLVGELTRRGRGRHESGAFLVGKRGDTSRKVARVIYYDDLDPDALRSGIVTLHARGMSTLWETCSTASLQVLADVHTHPGTDTRQSSVDRQYPMVPVAGHIGMILPHFGDTSIWSLKGVGVHVYEGSGRWTAHRGGAANVPVKLTTW